MLYFVSDEGYNNDNNYYYNYLMKKYINYHLDKNIKTNYILCHKTRESIKEQIYNIFSHFNYEKKDLMPFDLLYKYGSYDVNYKVIFTNYLNNIILIGNIIEDIFNLNYSFDKICLKYDFSKELNFYKIKDKVKELFENKIFNNFLKLLNTNEYCINCSFDNKKYNKYSYKIFNYFFSTFIYTLVYDFIEINVKIIEEFENKEYIINLLNSIEIVDKFANNFNTMWRGIDNYKEIMNLKKLIII